MTSTPYKHFQETKELAAQLDEAAVARWLLREGYYPEQYVLPPCFQVSDYDIQATPYFPIEISDGSQKLKPSVSELALIVLPKSMLTVRDFAIIDPRHYHDMVFHIVADWGLVLDHLFHDDLRIFSYSFPIPISRKEPGSVGHLRAGRMIYEFIEMADRDLVADAHKYKFILKTDISNFYASVYTHSIAWALHGKEEARRNRYSIDSLGKKLDLLTQRSNDGCTNGMAIGPAISDLISEILLAAIDKDCSLMLGKRGVDFVGVRFKDDYRFLCQSEDDARKIISDLQQCMKTYNLTLSESKSETLRLPEGLFRPWKSAYGPLSLRYKYPIHYRSFEATTQSVLAIDSQNPGTGMIDSFLSELTSRKQNLKLELGKKDRRRVYSLLLLLRERRPKSFPMFLAIVEAMLEKYAEDEDFKEYVRGSLTQMLAAQSARPQENQYEIIWLIYFIKTVLREKIAQAIDSSDVFVGTVENERREFWRDFTNGEFFHMPSLPVPRNHLLSHLAIFRAKQADDQGNEEE